MANIMLGKPDVRPNRPRDGRHCDLCGCSQPAVRCDKCGCQIFCLSCDDMYHRHPKRRFHLRKAVDPTPPTPQARPVLPMKIAHMPTSPGDPSKMPLPPPRKKKPGKSFFDTFRRRSPSSEQNSPPLPKKEYSWTDRLGNIKKFMSNRPLPPLPDTNGHENSDMQQSLQSTKHDLSFIHKRVEEKPPQLPQRSLKPNEFSRDKENFPEQPLGNIRNGTLDPNLMNRNRGFSDEENNWDNRLSGNPQLNTMNRQNQQGFFPQGGPGFPGNLSNSMHQSSSATDLQNLNNMDGYPGQGMPPPHYPHYPMNPHMPHFPYPMYHPQYPNYPQYFGTSFANLSSQPTTTDGDFSDQSEASSRHHSGKKYPFRKRAKRSQSVMVDRMAYPGQYPFNPFGPFPPGYGPGPWGAAPFPMEAPPSPASSVRSLNRVGRTRRRKKMTSDDEEEFSVSSSPLSRPKSSSSERNPPLQKKAPLATLTTSEEESEEEMEKERNKSRDEKPLRRNSDPPKQQTARRNSDPRRMPSPVPKSPQFHQKKPSKQKQREVTKHSDSEELPSTPTKVDRRPSRESITDQNDQDRATTIFVPNSQWQCNHCTFINPSGNRICQVCCKTASVEMVTLMTSRPSSATTNGNRKQSIGSEQSCSSPEKKMEEDDSIHTKRDNQDMAVLNSALDEAEEEINRGLKELMKLKEDFLPSKSPPANHDKQTESPVKTEETTVKSKPVYKSSGKMRTSILDKLNLQPNKQSTTSTSTETQTGPSKMDRIIEARRASTSSTTSDAYNSPTAQSPQLERTILASGGSNSKSNSRKESSCQTQTDDLMGYLERKKVEEEAYFGRVNNGHGFQYGDRMDTITSPVPTMYDRGFGGGYGMMQRSHSRASLFTGRMNDLGPMDYGLGPTPMYRSVSRSSLTGDFTENRFSEFHNLRKPDYYLSMEELVERRRQESIRAQGLELVRMIREAEQQGFTADDIQVALTNCGNQNPMEWLQENWRNMVENVISLSTSYANDKKENDIGTVSEGEARDALRMHKGNVWAAVIECVESRQRKFLELKARGKFSSKDITDALTASQGDVEAAYAKLTKSTSKPFLMRIWGAGEGVPNQDGAMPIGNEAYRPQSDRYTKDNTDVDDVLSDEIWEEDYEEDVDWEEDSEDPDEDEQGDLDDLRTCHDDLCISDEVKTPESDSEYADAFGSNTLERNVSSPASDTFFVIPEIKQEKKGIGLLSKLAALRREDRSAKQSQSKFYDSNTDMSSLDTLNEVKDNTSQDCSLPDQSKAGPLSVIKNTISAIRESVSGLKSDKKLQSSTLERRTIIVKGQIAHESLSDDSSSGGGVTLISSKLLKDAASSVDDTSYLKSEAVDKQAKSKGESKVSQNTHSQISEETLHGLDANSKSNGTDSVRNLSKDVGASNSATNLSKDIGASNSVTNLTKDAGPSSNSATNLSKDIGASNSVTNLSKGAGPSKSKTNLPKDALSSSANISKEVDSVDKQITKFSNELQPVKSEVSVPVSQNQASVLSKMSNVSENTNDATPSKSEDIRGKPSVTKVENKIPVPSLEERENFKKETDLNIENNLQKSSNSPKSLEIRQDTVLKSSSKQSNTTSDDQSSKSQAVMTVSEKEQTPKPSSIIKTEKKTEPIILAPQTDKTSDDQKKVKFKLSSEGNGTSKLEDNDKEVSNKTEETNNTNNTMSSNVKLKEESHRTDRTNSPNIATGKVVSDAIQSNESPNASQELSLPGNEKTEQDQNISHVETLVEISNKESFKVPDNIKSSSIENIQKTTEENMNTLIDTPAANKAEETENSLKKSLDIQEEDRPTQSLQEETKINNTAAGCKSEILPTESGEIQVAFRSKNEEEYSSLKDSKPSFDKDNSFTECPPVKSVIKDIDSRSSLNSASNFTSSLQTETIDMIDSDSGALASSVAAEQNSKKIEDASMSNVVSEIKENANTSPNLLPDSITNSSSTNISHVPLEKLSTFESEREPPSTKEENTTVQPEVTKSGISSIPEVPTIQETNKTEAVNEVNVSEISTSENPTQSTQVHPVSAPETTLAAEKDDSSVDTKRNAKGKPKLKLVKLTKKEKLSADKTTNSEKLSANKTTNSALPSTSEVKDISMSDTAEETNLKGKQNIPEESVTSSVKSTASSEIYPPSLIEVIKQIPVASGQPIKQVSTPSVKSAAQSQDVADTIHLEKEHSTTSVLSVSSSELPTDLNKDSQTSVGETSSKSVGSELNSNESKEQSDSNSLVSTPSHQIPLQDEKSTSSTSKLSSKSSAGTTTPEIPTEPSVELSSNTNTYNTDHETTISPASTTSNETTTLSTSTENNQHSKEGADLKTGSVSTSIKSSESTDSTASAPESAKDNSANSKTVSFSDDKTSEPEDEESSDDNRENSVSPPNPFDALRHRFEELIDESSPIGPVRPQSPYRRMSFRSRKAAIALERTRDTSTEKPWFLPKPVPEIKKTVPKRSLKQQLEIERRVRKMVADRKCRTYRKAEIVVQLIDMNFEEEEAIQAANDCSTLEQAISYLQQECLLCTGNFPVSHIISMVHCQHKACRECLRAYFTVQIRDRNIMELLCPFCNEPDIFDEDIAQDYFNHLDIMLKKLIDPEIHELFQRKLRDRVLMRDPNFKWCSQCSSGFIAMPNLKRLVCPDCNAVTCASCRRPWEREHQGISCEAFAAWKDAADPEAQTVSLAKLLTEDGIDCPRCHFRYALAKGGCMHFRCTQCQHDFCSGCSKPFKMGQKCGVSEFCGKLGLHAHHPRNCLFYLRDKEPEDLQRLLDLSEVKYDRDPLDKMDSKSTCQVMEQKETADGMLDDYCGKDVEEGFAGLCRLHYVEYLGQLVNKYKVDPIQIFENDDLELVLRRANIRLPPKRYRETDDQYREKLVNLIQDELPLDRVEGS